MHLSSIIKPAIMFALLSIVSTTGAYAADSGGTFTVGNGTFLLNGEPFVVKAAEVHYPRIPCEYWEHRIKMCKALGMNTLCLYVFWNIHEQKPDAYDFSGNNDVAEFCRLAQKNGMYVIVRPGPYVCAEWEMGGLPWWLLKKKDIELRTLDGHFMERVRKFEAEVGKQLAPLTIQNGGPIIMVQVENEYGSYGADKPYVSAIRDIVRENFGDVTLFQCDWASNFELNALEDLVWTMNFGTGADIGSQFRRLGELRPDSPKMCSEFWSGWFDKWGARHETRSAKDMVEGIDEMLSMGISFSLYMTHGGTSFGHWAGANSPGFAPDVTSYDYDAPINEYGLPTDKFYELRRVMQKHNGGKRLPPVPKSPMPTVSVPKFRLTEFSPIMNGVKDVKAGTASPLTFEEMDLGWGSMVYSCTLPELAEAGTLNLNGAHDYAQVFIDGEYVGKTDRVKNEKTVRLPACKEGARLTILVEGMGRINFGRAIKDFKGLTEDITISTSKGDHLLTYTLQNWTNSTIPDSYANALAALDAAETGHTAEDMPGRTAGYYRGHFSLKKAGDTFLNFETWGKGLVYVNGHALGRIWSIGPQQTLYVPGCWLKKGRNEVIVLDVVGPKDASAWGQATPEIDKLQIERKQNANFVAIEGDINSDNLALSGSFLPGNGWQKVQFKPVTGRYAALQAVNVQDGGQTASVAELYLLDANGERLSREPWTVRAVSSEDIETGNNTGDKVFDLQESTYWQSAVGEDLPHTIVIDLGGEQTITGLEYLPRAEQNAPGSLRDYKLFVFK